MEFSEYEKRMIGFFIGHGLNEENARQEVINSRVGYFGDSAHQITKEGLDSLMPPPLSEILAKANPNEASDDGISAFREHIGEDAWKALGANNVDPKLLRMAIDFGSHMD